MLHARSLFGKLRHLCSYDSTVVMCICAACRFKVYKGVVKGKPNNTGSAIKQRFQARQW
jgi:hypothetical protein